MNIKRCMTKEERFGLVNLAIRSLIGLMVVLPTIMAAGNGYRGLTIFIHSAFIGVVLMIKYVRWVDGRKSKAQIFHEMVVAAEEKKGHEVVEMAEKLGIYIETSYSDKPRLYLPEHIVGNARPYDLGTLMATIIHLDARAMIDLASVAGSIWESHPVYATFMPSRLKWFKQVMNGVRASRHSELAEDLIKGLHDYLVKRKAEERDNAASNAINTGLDVFVEKADDERQAISL